MLTVMLILQSSMLASILYTKVSGYVPAFD